MRRPPPHRSARRGRHLSLTVGVVAAPSLCPAAMVRAKDSALKEDSGSGGQFGKAGREPANLLEFEALHQGRMDLLGGCAAAQDIQNVHTCYACRT